MREEALALARAEMDPGRKLHVMREYLQACVLRSLHESEAFLGLSFVGGTALRFLFNLPRFSEDLDFSLEDPSGYEPVRWMEAAKRSLSLAGFEVTVRWNERKTVHSAWFRVANLLKPLGLAAMASQNLSIKLEIDTRPPAGANTVKTVVNRHQVFALRHHDLSSLMAGKVHALIARSYPKGRDWYDLLWYRSQRPPPAPNRPFLQRALDQTEGQGKHDASQWRALVLERLDLLDMAAVRADVGPFLERPGEIKWMERSYLRNLLENEP